MGIAFVFPGQGSQSVGMLQDLAGRFGCVRETFAAASAVLGYDLWTLVQQGPVTHLNETERTQPAMLAAGVAVFRTWLEADGPRPGFVSGHSLGEFTALVCAEALPFDAAIELVRFRGEVMQKAVPLGAGGMAAILGLDDAIVVAICQEAAQGGVVEAVNFNAPGQVVIAGDAQAIARAIDLATTRGAKRAVPLPVSVPSHSSLMKGAAERFGERLSQVQLRAPRIEYVSAVDAASHGDPKDIRSLLVRQLASPVRWTETVAALLTHGVDYVVECGPGKVLTGLNRQIARRSGQRSNVQYLALEDHASLEQAIAAAKGTEGA
jgi:[acyl-carrier-protein] S-malonyltransferase